MITVSECKLQCNLLKEEVEFDEWFNMAIPAAVAYLPNALNRQVFAAQSEITEEVSRITTLIEAENAETDDSKEKIESLTVELKKVNRAIVFNGDLKLALLMLMAHWFNNRESTSALSLNDTPMAFHMLTHPHRSYFK